MRSASERLSALEAAPGPPDRRRTMEPLDRILLDVYDVATHGHFVFVTHPDPAVREAGRVAAEAADRWFNAFRLRRSIYQALRSIRPDDLDSAARHALEKLLREMRRAGVELSESEAEEVRKLTDEIDVLANRYQANVNRLVREVMLTDPADLDGLPDDYRAAHRPDASGSIRLTTQYPDALPVFAYAERAETRHRLLLEFMNRAYPENLAVLTELLDKRYALARRLGYRNYADYVIEDKMMATTPAAWAFLERLAVLLAAPAAAHRARLLDRKRKDFPGATALEPWDGGGWAGRFYEVKLQNEEFGVDRKLLRAYLPYVAVRDGLMRLCERLFDLEIVRVETEPTWHPTIEVYDVRRHGAPLGRFYLDLVPRDGKYGHAAQFDLTVGIRDQRLPRAALVCNFLDPKTPVAEALMEYGDVVTFFHEFGHLLHTLFSGHGEWLYNAADFIEWDFVEVPSQLFEEWARDPGVLSTFARRPSDGAPIPAALLQRMKAAESLGRSNNWLIQTALASVSLAFYDREPSGIDTGAVFREAFARFHPMRPPEGTHQEAAFGHLVGYSAIYYTYAWSLVIARDLLSRFLDKGSLTDPELAKRYVDSILAPGSSRTASELIRSFLDRDFRFDAFERWALTDPFRSTGPSDTPKAPPG